MTQVGFARVIWAEYIAPILLLDAALRQSGLGQLILFNHSAANPLTQFPLRYRAFRES